MVETQDQEIWKVQNRLISGQSGYIRIGDITEAKHKFVKNTICGEPTGHWALLAAILAPMV